MTSAADVARALGGRKAGRGYVAKCPAHQDSNPSLSLADGNRGLLVKCHAGCGSRDVLAELRRRGLLEQAATAATGARNAPRPMHEPQKNESDVDRSRRALAVWAEARDPRGTPAWTYLFKRGIALEELPDRISEAVRFHPRCPWEGERRACLVGLWRDAVTSDPRAIHRRLITPAGEKADVWKALGPTASCVIRLSPDEFVSNSLVIGEGIETTLAAATRIEHRGTLLRPAWAAGDAGHLEAFPVLPGIEALTILVDNDESGRGQRAAAECARRWTAAGREVIQLTPRVVGADFNDLVAS